MTANMKYKIFVKIRNENFDERIIKKKTMTKDQNEEAQLKIKIKNFEKLILIYGNVSETFDRTCRFM